MAIHTNLRNRIRNTQLPLSSGLMPLFEAVQNSIHAIEEVAPSCPGRITVEILREVAGLFSDGDRTKKRGPETQPEIFGFRITDDGIGFTDRHLESFETLDSDFKAKIGGKGIGRLLWLKAFRNVSIDSRYVGADGKFRRRTFSFSPTDGVIDLSDRDVADGEIRQTTVELSGFEEKYRQACRKTMEAIANQLLEHCLWYFVRTGGAPTIVIRDGEGFVSLDDVYDRQMHSSAEHEQLEIKGHKFDLTHLKLSATTTQSHMIGWCAANRLVKEDALSSRVPGLFGKLGDDGNQFIYACYVTSPYLDERVRPERTDFVLEKTRSDGLFTDDEISEDELSANIVKSVRNYLSQYLEEKRKAGLERVNRFVAEVQPRYRPILSRIPIEELYVDPSISDRELDVVLHRHRSDVERELLAEGHKVMSPALADTAEEYEARVKHYLDLANDLKKSDLAEYVSHRKVILDLLKIGVQRNEDGKYSREDLIHELIMPLRTTSNSAEFERNNLWLIDDRLTFHDYLASDITLRSAPVSGSTSTKEPDILALNVYDQPILVSEGSSLPLASIVVVELKRPMRNDMASGEEKDPIEQTLSYLKKIRDGNVRTAAGRQIPNSSDIPGFCYILCDLTESMRNRCEIHGYTRTSDYLGYFGYNGPLKAYVEVISFDRLLNNGYQRNRAFFASLGLPNN
ncbi:MAG: sensor histidine kinase [Pseudomonadales bacterium]|nr:sensor histidine kinase [Pseudomonadales bacterium]